MYFNNKIVQPGFHKDGIYFSTLGINMIVEIPEIGATITFSGLIFSVKLPYSKFGNNTEGQCGKTDVLIIFCPPSIAIVTHFDYARSW